MTTVAFLGTGIMGFPMARNLADAGLTVRAWNRTPEKAQMSTVGLKGTERLTALAAERDMAYVDAPPRRWASTCR